MMAQHRFSVVTLLTVLLFVAVVQSAIIQKRATSSSVSKISSTSKKLSSSTKASSTIKASSTVKAASTSKASSSAKSSSTKVASSTKISSSTKAASSSKVSTGVKIGPSSAVASNPRTGSTTSPASADATGWYAIPQKGIPANRADAIATKQQNFGYGPAVAGGPFFPNGSLGNTFINNDVTSLQAEADTQMSELQSDAQTAGSDYNKYNGLQTLDDYTLLYDDEWLKTLPAGPIPGILTNYTQDLLFSMERLSLSPYQIRRLNSSDPLNFQVDDATATNITGMTQQQLLTSGRLFYADYRDQAKLEATTKARYSAAVDAYFYIDQTSGDFLPLAIRTNKGNSVIYTPADSANDWLLAKIMYNTCDIWFAQWEHLSRTHEVVQIVYMSAIRTLSDFHPVKAILDRRKLANHDVYRPVTDFIIAQ